MDVAQDLIYYFILYLFEAIKDSIFKFMLFIKTTLVVTLCELLYRNFIPTIYENFKSVSLNV